MYITIIFGLLIASLLGMSAWFLASTVHRLLGSLMFLFSVPLTIYAFISLMGSAKPVYPPIFDTAEGYTVVRSVSYDEPNMVYILMSKEDDPEPRLYAFPWDQLFAEKLQRAMVLSDGNHKVRITMSDLTGNGYGVSADIPPPDPPKVRTPTQVTPMPNSGLRPYP